MGIPTLLGMHIFYRGAMPPSLRESRHNAILSKKLPIPERLGLVAGHNNSTLCQIRTFLQLQDTKLYRAVIIGQPNYPTRYVDIAGCSDTH